MGRRCTALDALLAALLLSLAACTSSGTGVPSASSPPTTSRDSTSPTAPISRSSPKSIPPFSRSSSDSDPRGKAAVAAYLSFTGASHAAERSPGKNHAVELRAHAVDPALGTIEALLTKLQLAGIANRGTPPKPRVKITKQDLEAHPWPVVTLADCPTVSPSWAAYDVATGKRVKVVPNSSEPPYAVTATVIKYKGRWVVSKTSVDRKHTCTP